MLRTMDELKTNDPILNNVKVKVLNKLDKLLTAKVIKE